ncbi:MAG TPA: hypothetical protein VIZ28_09775 [Chitinophagaceae bacterium]
MSKLLLILVAVFAACNSQKKVNLRKELLLKIDFQDSFHNDTVSVTINGYEIIENVVINSAKVTGRTELSLSVNQENKMMYIEYFNKVKKIKYQSYDKLIFGIRINTLMQALNYDILKGKYIGVNKGNNDSLIILQSTKPYMYE